MNLFASHFPAISAAIIGSLLFAFSPVHAGLSISPAYVELNFDKGRPSGQFRITNVGEQEERYRIKAIHFELLVDGAVKEIQPDERSLAPWVVFNPKELTLPPKSTQIVRFSVIPRGKLRPGEYWAAMELESLDTSSIKGKDDSGRGMSIQVITALLVPIFAKSGVITHQGGLKTVRMLPVESGGKLEVVFNNAGNGRIHVTADYIILASSGEELDKGPLGSGYVLPGSDRRFTRKIIPKIPDGRYTVKVLYTTRELNQQKEEQVILEWPSKS